jgi:hypothetical protein
METPTDAAAVDAKKANDDLITIAGGVELEATQLDGSKETVKVRQIPVSKINAFLSAMGNEAELIELYCDKPKGWTDTLTLESASAIADKGQEINLPFFSAWFRRQAKWREGQQQGTIAELEKKIAEMGGRSPSGNLPPQSPTTTS